MRFLFKTTLYSITCFVSLFVIIQFFDAREPENIFQTKDLKGASFQPDNGFYQLMVLCSSPEKKISTHGDTEPIRKISDPLYISQINDENYQLLIDEFKASNPCWKNMDDSPAPDENDTNWMAFYLSKQKEIMNIREKYDVFIERYDMILNSARFEDFSPPSHLWPIPRLHLLLKLSNLYIGHNLLAISDGKWDQGISNILKQINFAKQMVENSRMVITYVSGLKILDQSLLALTQIMKLGHCPGKTYARILNTLPPLEYSQIRFKNPLIYEYLITASMVDIAYEESQFETIKVLKMGGILDSMMPAFLNSASKLLIQKNRTTGYILEYYKRLIDLETLQPFKWTVDIKSFYQPKTQGNFWWLRNPGGKMLSDISTPNFSKIVLVSYSSQARYDLTRICAELNLEANTGQPKIKTLAALKSYKAIDPFSGKPYQFNEKESLLYSIGTNRMDDSGASGQENGFPLDIAVSLK